MNNKLNSSEIDRELNQEYTEEVEEGAYKPIDMDRFLSDCSDEQITSSDY